MRGRILILLEIPLILVIILQSWYKPFPLWVYLLALGLLGIIIAVSIHTQARHQVFVIVQILLLALLIRNIYFLSTHYSVLPFGDCYGEYRTTRAFLQQGKVSVLSGTPLKFYSGWPGIHLLGIALSTICDIDLLTSATVLPWFFFIGWFIFNYLLLQKIEQALHLKRPLMPFMLLVIAIAPIFITPTFEHQDFALLLFLIILYLVYNNLFEPSVTNIVLLLVCTASLVIAHHYTSFIVVLYFAFISSLVALSKYLSIKKKHRYPSLRVPISSLLSISLIALVCLFSWWNVFAPMAPYLAGRGTQLVQAPTTEAPTTEAPTTEAPTIKAGWRPYMPPLPHLVSLTPGWMLTVLHLRDAMLIIGAIFGFVLLCIKRIPLSQKFFIISSLTFAIAITLVDTFIVWAGPYRVITFFLPLVALCIAIFLSKVKSKLKGIFAGLIPAVVVLLVFSSLTGFWGHRYAPMHLYDPATSWVEAGEHPADWKRLEIFSNQYIEYKDTDEILTDDPFILSLFLPPDRYPKIQGVELTGVSVEESTMTVAFREMSPGSYITVGEAEQYNPKFNILEFKQQLNENSNLIYNDGKFKIWRNKC